MDVLADVLTVTQLGNTILAYAKMISPWGIEIPADFHASVHIVLRGSFWLRVEDETPLLLAPGDVLLIGTGVRHSMLDQPNTKGRSCSDVLAEMPGRFARLKHDHSKVSAEILCAKYRFAHQGAHPLVSRLPRLIHLTSTDVAGNAQLHLLTQMLHLEAQTRGSGTDLVVPRLVDTLLVFIVRTWLQTQGAATSHASWFSALRDPGIGRALSMIHDSPGQAWTVESLARSVGQSRATFARRFAELVGETPAAYLLCWRMCVAAKALRESDRTIDTIAEQLGYQSGVAFAKAFKRHHAVAPGQFRRERAGTSFAPVT